MQPAEGSCPARKRRQGALNPAHLDGWVKCRQSQVVGELSLAFDAALMSPTMGALIGSGITGGRSPGTHCRLSDGTGHPAWQGSWCTPLRPQAQAEHHWRGSGSRTCAGTTPGPAQAPEG